MNTSYNDARELRLRATEYARRASATADPEMENSFRRLAHHWLIRAAELEQAGGSSAPAGKPASSAGSA
jgi:hypothetical protein